MALVVSVIEFVIILFVASAILRYLLYNGLKINFNSKNLRDFGLGDFASELKFVAVLNFLIEF